MIGLGSIVAGGRAIAGLIGVTCVTGGVIEIVGGGS
jgi:hypothetical protein